MQGKSFSIAVLWLLAVAAMSAGAGEIYTWKDKDGRVNYGDNPPAGSSRTRTLSGKDAETVTQPAMPAAVDKAGPRTAAEQDLEFRKRQAETADQKAKADKDATAAEEKKNNCERARGQLAALESGQRITRTSSKGEREYIDDKQRADEIANAKKSVESWCK
jgi:hypothetical protein